MQGSFFWDSLQYRQLSDYLKAMQNIFAEGDMRANIMKAYACLLGLEFLAQAKMQRRVEDVIGNYKAIRLTEDEAKGLAANPIEAITRMHAWALALEPHFRGLRSAESATMVAGQGILDRD
jgi:hypothetical protein